MNQQVTSQRQYTTSSGGGQTEVRQSYVQQQQKYEYSEPVRTYQNFSVTSKSGGFNQPTQFETENFVQGTPMNTSTQFSSNQPPFNVMSQVSYQPGQQFQTTKQTYSTSHVSSQQVQNQPAQQHQSTQQVFSSQQQGFPQQQQPMFGPNKPQQNQMYSPNQAQQRMPSQPAPQQQMYTPNQQQRMASPQPPQRMNTPQQQKFSSNQPQPQDFPSGVQNQPQSRNMSQPQGQAPPNVYQNIPSNQFSQVSPQDSDEFRKRPTKKVHAWPPQPQTEDIPRSNFEPSHGSLSWPPTQTESQDNKAQIEPNPLSKELAQATQQQPQSQPGAQNQHPTVFGVKSPQGQQFGPSGQQNKPFSPQGQGQQPFGHPGQQSKSFIPQGQGQQQIGPSGQQPKPFSPQGQGQQQFSPIGQQSKPFSPPGQNQQQFGSLGQQTKPFSPQGQQNIPGQQVPPNIPSRQVQQPFQPGQPNIASQQKPTPFSQPNQIMSPNQFPQSRQPISPQQPGQNLQNTANLPPPGKSIPPGQSPQSKQTPSAKPSFADNLRNQREGSEPIVVPEGRQPMKLPRGTDWQQQRSFDKPHNYDPSLRGRPYGDGNLPKEWPPKNAGGPNMTMTYPSAFKLRDEAPIDPQTAPMGTVPSQPAFKTVVPGRKRGDDVWPPKGAFQDGSTTTGDDAMKPTRIEKDYDEFFLRNALPSNYPGYQIPPGTQHVGFLDEAQPL